MKQYIVAMGRGHRLGFHILLVVHGFCARMGLHVLQPGLVSASTWAGQARTSCTIISWRDTAQQLRVTRPTSKLVR